VSNSLKCFLMVCRTVRQGEPGTEHNFTVFTEHMFTKLAEPAMGTKKERMRVNVPYPIELNLTGDPTVIDVDVACS
jgi:hypothetical protein